MDVYWARTFTYLYEPPSIHQLSEGTHEDCHAKPDGDSGDGNGKRESECRTGQSDYSIHEVGQSQRTLDVREHTRAEEQHAEHAADHHQPEAGKGGDRVAGW